MLPWRGESTLPWPWCWRSCPEADEEPQRAWDVGLPCLGVDVWLPMVGESRGGGRRQGQDEKKKGQGEEKEPTLDQMIRFSSFPDGQLDGVGLSWPARGRGGAREASTLGVRATVD